MSIFPQGLVWASYVNFPWGEHAETPIPQFSPKQKQLYLQSLKGAQAHQAWLERGSTEETESRPTTPTPEEVSQLSNNNLDNDDHPQIPRDHATSQGGAAQSLQQYRAGQGEIDCPSEEPLTPPSSAVKSFKAAPAKSNFASTLDLSAGDANVQELRAKEQEKRTKIFHDPRGILGELAATQSLSGSGTFAQAPTSFKHTSTENLQSSNSSPYTKLLAPGLDHHRSPINTRITSFEPPSRRGREPSVASESLTEVADPAHIEQSVLTSQRLDAPSAFHFPAPHSSFNREGSPELGSSLRLIKIRPHSDKTPGIPAKQVRLHWQHRSPTPNSPHLTEGQCPDK